MNFIRPLLIGVMTALLWLSQAHAEIGAIQGVFDVSASGSATYSLPIRTVPGSAGVAPKLSLVYSSQSLGGPLGAGWGISGLSTISRGPRNLEPHGRITGVNLDDSDILLLDGEELVVVSVSGAGAAMRTEYRKRTDDYTRVIRYGSSLESSRFEADTKGGLKLVFDGTNGSRVKAGGLTVLLAISRIRDSAGNFISFEYEQNGNGDYNIVAVRYTGHESLATGAVDRPPFAQLAFDYEAAPRAAEAFISGKLVSRDRRLKSVTSALSSGPPGQTQLAKYLFNYQDTETLSRFVLTSIREQGADGSELSPTTFSYTKGEAGWQVAPAQLPILATAARETLGLGYRAGNFTEGDNQPDLLFAMELDGKLEAFAFASHAGAWSREPKFKPPFAFASSDGVDLGAIVADLNGDGRQDLLQSVDRSSGAERAAYLAGKDKWEDAAGYKLSFPLVKDGKSAAAYLLGPVSGSTRPDLIYETASARGLLLNTGTGWALDTASLPTVTLKEARLLDLDCDGRQELLAPVAGPGGVAWKGWRYASGQWAEVHGALLPPAATAAVPAALRVVRLNTDSCPDLIYAAAGQQALLGSPAGWSPADSRLAPSFELVDAAGASLEPLIADFNGDGLSEVLVNRIDEQGGVVAFAYRQAADGWHADAAFMPPPLLDLRRKVQAKPIVLDVNGDGASDLALPNDARESFGAVFLGGATKLTEAPNFVPRVLFARKDLQDRGVRFVDLNADGLVDVLFRRDVVRDGKTDTASDALINTGQGWRSVAGLKPPVAFAGDGITGSPAQFADVDGDGFVDLLYSYNRADGTKVRAFYRNADDGAGGRRWIDVTGSALKPPDAYPFAVEDVGDQGVRLLDIDGDGRVDLLFGSISPKAPGDLRPIGDCGSPLFPKPCEWNRELFRVAAFRNDGSKWVTDASYAPPVPLASLGDATSNAASDLFVQVLDVSGDRLPDIVAGFRHPHDMTKSVLEIWVNNGHGWDKSGMVPPTMLDEPATNYRALVQWTDVNGDGLPDLVRSERQGGSNLSTTWLATGRGFEARTAFVIPLDAIADQGGDPGFRLADVNGDGLPDIVSTRSSEAGDVERRLWLNTGSAFNAAPDTAVKLVPAMVDFEGRDQGVRLLDLDADGLTDVVQSYAEGPSNEVAAAVVLLNSGARSDMLREYSGGFGLRTTIAYQPMSRPLAPGAAPWARVYEPARSGAQYPFVAPVPATYLVARVVVSDATSQQLGFSYRYGPLLFHGLAMRSLGYAWRETLNEQSRVLDRTEFNQTLLLAGRVQSMSACVLDPTGPTTAVNLCPSGQGPGSSRRLRVVDNDWAWFSGQVGPAGQQETITQIMLRSTAKREWELDGGLVSLETTAITYEGEVEGAEILARHGNVAKTLATLGDGTTVETRNIFSDDLAGWRLGRLTRSTVVKTGDLVSPGGTARKTETRIADFTYDPLTGLLDSDVTDPGDPHAITKRYVRDTSGNITRVTSSAANLESRVNETDLDPLGRYSVAERLIGKSLRFETRFERDPRTGGPLTRTEPNGAVTTSTYDGFGRPQDVKSPTGVVTKIRMLRPEDLSDKGALDGLAAAYANVTQVGVLPPTIEVFDARSRLLRTVSEGFVLFATQARPVQVDIAYDSMGRVVRRSLPYDRGQAPNWVVTQYDVLNRAVAVQTPDGSSARRTYAARPGGGRVLSVRDPLGRATSIEVDERGLTRVLRDAKNGRVVYEYDAAGRLQTATGATGLKIRHRYDALGRREQTSDPDLGVWDYRYDAFGQLVEQTDAKKQLTTFEYDPIGRIVARKAPDRTVRWEYDQGAGSLGKLSRVYETDKYEKSFDYDSVGRAIGETVTISGEPFRTRIKLDDYGRVETSTYPTAEGQQGITVKNQYDVRGFLYRITDLAGGNLYWEALAADADGRVTWERDGNGVSTRRAFGPKNGRPASIKVSGPQPGAELLDLDLAYDSVGNLLRRREGTRNIDEKFAYDELNRLVRLTNTDGSADTYAFDAAGRMTFKSDVGTLTYASTAVPGVWAPAHGVVEARLGAKVTTYAYDANGNRKEDSRRTYAYTSDNRLAHVELKAQPKVSLSFLYDPSGDRYAEVYAEAGRRQETTTVGLFERVREFTVSPGQPPLLKRTRFRYSIGGPNGVLATVELVKPVAAAAALESHVWYLHKDQLGSVLRITDEKGQLAARFWYDPWGRTSSVFLTPGAPLKDAWNRTFASHQLMQGLGLIHMNGRVYDYEVAQFLTPDPLGEGVGGTQTLNRFAYVQGNPLRHVDSTGYGLWEDVTQPIRDFGNAVAKGVNDIGGEVGRWFGSHWREVVIVAAAIITVASFGSSCVATCTIIAGMTAGAVAGATAAALYGGTFEDILFAAARGAIIGGVTAGFSMGIGDTFANGTAANYAAHGVLGGVTEAAQGGEFGRGFFVGSASAIVNTYVPEVGETGSSLETARAALVGGTISVISGGNFANGAIMAAFAYRFNYAMHKRFMNPVGAFADYLAGDGQTVAYNLDSIEEIDPRSLIKGDDGRLTQVGLSLAAGDGDYVINTKEYGNGIPYATKSFGAATTVGSVTLHLEGSMHVSQGQYYFRGTLTVANDNYNMNAANRGGWKEAATTFGRNVGRMTGSKPYTVEIHGSRAVGASGYIGP